MHGTNPPKTSYTTLDNGNSFTHNLNFNKDPVQHKASGGTVAPIEGGARLAYADGGEVADNAQQQAPAQPPTSTNVVSPEGDLVSIPNEQLQAALHPVNGYRLATPDDVSAYQSQQKYGTPRQIAQTAAESAVQQATFGAVPGFGSAERTSGEQQENPIASILGGVAPFAAEAFIPGAGEAGAATMAARAATTVPRLIGEAGEAVKTASGLSGVGAKALQYAAEGAIMQGSNEVSKALLKDLTKLSPTSLPVKALRRSLAAL